MNIKIERHGFKKLEFEKLINILCTEFSVRSITVQPELRQERDYFTKISEIDKKCSEFLNLTPMYKVIPSDCDKAVKIPGIIGHFEVFSFLKKKLKSLDLKEYFLNTGNETIIYRYCKHFVSMEYKGFMLLSDICSTMKIQERFDNYNLTELYFYALTYHIYYSFLVPILKHNFYWCQSSPELSTVEYFTYYNWHIFLRQVGKRFVERRIFNGPIDQFEVANNDERGVALVRCVIKNAFSGDYRLVSNLRFQFSTKKRITAELCSSRDFIGNEQQLFDFFNDLKSTRPELVSHGIYTTNSFEAIRQYRLVMLANQCQRFFIVRADIRSCYESINHSILRCIYLNLIAQNNIETTLLSRDLRRNQLNTFLNNIYLKLGNDYYHQVCGVPQGSCISLFLCNIYMLHIRKKELADFINDDRAIFHQYVDDILYITSSYDKADSFLKRIISVYPKYGMELNESKILCSWLQEDLPRTILWLGYNINEMCEVTFKYPSLIRNLSRFSGVPRNAKDSYKLLKRKLFYLFKKKSIIVNTLEHSLYSEVTIKSNCRLLGGIFANIVFCVVRVCLNKTDLLSRRSSEKIAVLLKSKLYDFLKTYEYYKLAVQSLKAALTPFKGQMKWIIQCL